MPKYLVSISGNLMRQYPDPFMVNKFEDALNIIEQNLLPDINVYSDMISIYEMPDSPGRAKLVWRFTGMEFIEDIIGSEKLAHQIFLDVDMASTFPQGHLLNHESSLYEELIDDDLEIDDGYENDEYLDTLLDNLPRVAVENVNFEKE